MGNKFHLLRFRPQLKFESVSFIVCVPSSLVPYGTVALFVAAGQTAVLEV